jgi:site-specific recombinase XerD
MRIIIYKPLPTAKRIKVFIPYELHSYRVAFKKLDSSFWHPHQKLWSVINTKSNMLELKKLFKGVYDIEDMQVSSKMKTRVLTSSAEEALYSLEKVLTLKSYGISTINNYKSMFRVFLSSFMDYDLKQITKEQIEDFVYKMIQKHKISESVQNQLINSIKAYYEHVLGLPREYYEITRPKRSVNLPNVLSEDEVYRIIQFPTNLKHRAILWTIYSAGLRISELINLRINDIHSKEGFIFVKDSKGKKDRKTVLSEYLVELLREYYKSYRPSYWLFEGQTGGKYSYSSIREIFRKAVAGTNSNPWATVHTLRHSFATHSIQNNVSLRHIQSMLGHNSPKTTEIYTKTIEINNKKISSPLDNLFKNGNLRA